jgi:ParB-like chromosome segregation protein Spo0J
MKVSIREIKPNPNNPRLVKDDNFKKLVESVKGFPDMLNVRPIVVNKDMIVLGGNMRLKAMKEAGYKEANIEIVDWTEEQQREFIIKDNIGYGEWDWNIIANEWDAQVLQHWGLEIPIFKDTEEQEDISDKIKQDFRIEVVCKDEMEQEQKYNKLIEMGYECRLLTL